MAQDLHLGIDTGGTATKYVVCDAGGECTAAGEVTTDPGDVSATLSRLVAAVGPALGGDGLPRLAGAGLACAGIVDPVAGRLGRSPNLPGWQGVDLRAAMHGVLGRVSVVLVNDVNAALWGEFVAGAGRGCRDLVMFALGTGVGGGIVVDGRLVTGTRCAAAELGHMVLAPDGPPCACGNRGCLEAWAGSTALRRAARTMAVAGGPAAEPLAKLVARRGDALNTRDLAGLAEEGDAAVRDLFATAGRYLGQAVGNVVNVLDPDRVIIGGGVAGAGELLLGPCREEADRVVLAEAAVPVTIVTAELGPTAAAVGAARLAAGEGNVG